VPADPGADFVLIQADRAFALFEQMGWTAPTASMCHTAGRENLQ
jgi:hypothetical protein